MPKLQPEVSKKYNLKKGLQVTTMITRPPRIRVNLATMTLKQADDYVARGYDFIVLKKGFKSEEKNDSENES